MHTLFSFATPMIQALGWTLLHSIWQALLVYICLKTVLYLWPQAGARTKYNLSFLSLAGIFAWFCITLWSQLSAVRQWQYELQYTTSLSLQDMPTQTALATINEPELRSMFPHLEVCFPLLVALYIAGVVVMLIKLLVDLRQLHHIKTRQVTAASAEWEAHLPRLMGMLGITRQVKLLVSTYLQVPVMMGYLKPAILMPAAMLSQLSTEQLEAILLHELAHIKRNDYLLNIFQSIAETLLFFNPFVWWISKNIRLEREHCCDDLVVAHTAHPLHYAKALVVLEEYRFTSNSLAMAAADDKQHLFHRIKRIMEMKTKNLNYSQRLLAMLIIAGSLISIAWLNPDQQTASQPVSEKLSAPAPVVTTAMHHEAAAVATALQTAANSTPSVIPSAVAASQDTVPAKPSTPAAVEKEKTDESIVTDEQTVTSSEESTDTTVSGQRIYKRVDKRMNRVERTDMPPMPPMPPFNRLQMSRDLKAATDKIDWKKIDQEVTTALDKIDWGKINQEITKALKESSNAANVSKEDIEAAVREGLKSAKESMVNVNRNDIRRNVMIAQQQLRNIDFNKISEETRRNVEKALERHKDVGYAYSGTRSAVRYQDTDYKDMINQLHQEQLIEKDKSFSIRLKGDDLLINGKKQPEDIKRRYHRYLDNVKSLDIKGGKNSLSISVSK